MAKKTWLYRQARSDQTGEGISIATNHDNARPEVGVDGTLCTWLRHVHLCHQIEFDPFVELPVHALVP